MKEIAGYEGLYVVDEGGTVWSLIQDNSRRKGPLKPYVNVGGYLRVNLYKNGNAEHKYVHRLVAEAYLPNPNGLPDVNHIDANPANNSISNLEWCTAKQNIMHSRKLGNQNKDRHVRAISIITGEVREYGTMNAAGIDLFGKYYALRYHCKRKGTYFGYRGWIFEVAP
jgi:hypothetical protein